MTSAGRFDMEGVALLAWQEWMPKMFRVRAFIDEFGRIGPK